MVTGQSVRTKTKTLAFAAILNGSTVRPARSSGNFFSVELAAAKDSVAKNRRNAKWRKRRKACSLEHKFQTASDRTWSLHNQQSVSIPAVHWKIALRQQIVQIGGQLEMPAHAADLGQRLLH